MERRVFKYSVPVDDRWHEIVMPLSTVLHVACQTAVDDVQFWAEYEDGLKQYPRRFQVFGTGHSLPSLAIHRGTVLVGHFVWHLYEDWSIQSVQMVATDMDELVVEVPSITDA